jgi:co-chaperonin GroES (HSP10)
MKRTLLSLAPVVTLILLPLLGGCGSGENSVTGPDRALNGQVVPVGDLAGASPAGISVTALGQMAARAGRSVLADRVAITDATGRFAFMGLSGGNVQLAFSRGDGISASVTASASAATVVVELQKKQATIRDAGQSTRELEGPITAISATSITVNDASTGPQTAVIAPTTVIRKGNTALLAADLKVGDRVHVKASVGTDSTLTAAEIMLQNVETTGDGGQTKELEGLITKVSDTSITVMNASTAKPETAAITKSTIIRKGNTTLTAKDLKVGDRVHVKTTANTDGTLTATEITLQNPA